MNYACRPFAPDEFPAAFAVFKRCWQADTIQRGCAWDDGTQHSVYHADFIQNGLEFILCNHDIVGVLGVDAVDDAVHIRQFCLVPDWQDQGLGGLIVTDLKRRAVLLGRPLTVRTFKSNLRAHAFYARHDFTIHDRTDTHVCLRFQP